MGFLGGVFGSERKQFGRKVLQHVRGHASVWAADYDPADDTVFFELRGGGTGWISVSLLYQRCGGRTGTELCDAVHETIMRAGPALTTTQDGQNWARIAPRLRPMLREVEQSHTPGQDHSPSLHADGPLPGVHKLARPVLPYLVEMVVIDRLATLEFVTTRHLENWGVDEDTAYAIAHDNMAVLAMNTLAAFEPGDGMRILEFDDDKGETYVGSLPLVPGWLAGVVARTGTRPILFFPQHVGMYLVLGATDDGLRVLMAKIEEHYRAAARPVSPVPYTVDDDGELVPLWLPDTDPAWKPLRHAESVLEARAYTLQARILEDDEELASRAILSAIKHVRRADGTEFTFTTWVDGGVTHLLPRAHVIVLVDTAGTRFGVTWDDVAAFVEFPAVPGFSPPRYRAEGHPPADIMARLRALAVPF
ncbi:hypothetical protein H0264_16075 [Nocardia huaxiensis]|uniref:Uncharacterized protein n=1 Tax=Nocardia huaxiensis TaxID=2755382 RepID=A0A7D6VFX5_9NOCA|nr:hypothetical protein [Nocardia huaxiensis]QLY33542.1 hypothetical protein H0264_16075 [Nocardia huaxiensis]